MALALRRGMLPCTRFRFHNLKNEAGTAVSFRADSNPFGPLFLEPILHDGQTGLSPVARSTLSSKEN